MKISSFKFQTSDWFSIPQKTHRGETGVANWQTQMINEIRVRMVEYSPGYKADHWCRKGHIIFCIEGEMQTELEDGSVHTLNKGMNYFVGDNCEAHRSSSKNGCKLFIVD
jgi:quercetin dioxygenase-like cupin family protein